MIADINPGVNGSDVEELIVFGDMLFFRARHDTYGTDLWKYNDRLILLRLSWIQSRIEFDDIKFNSL